MVLFLVVAAGQSASGVEISATATSVAPQSCTDKQAQNYSIVEKVNYITAESDRCPGHTCITYSCGGDSNTLVCCPQGYPYLSHCDCLCYESSPDCNSYTRCSIP